MKQWRDPPIRGLFLGNGCVICDSYAGSLRRNSQTAHISTGITLEG
jgi:hypothetical protein